MTENQTRSDVDVCPYWMAPFLDNPFRRLAQNPDKILAGMVQPGQTAVDLGCGPGYFTMALARLVGEQGRVIAVDMQEKMLKRVERNAARKGLTARVQVHQCSQERIGLEGGTADFALTFWMVHEVPDQGAFLREIHGLLKPGGHYLLVEPGMHVGEMDFQKTVDQAGAAGFTPESQPKISLSRSVLFKRV